MYYNKRQLTMIDKKMIMNELYDTLLYIAAGVGVSMISKKVFGKGLGAPDTIEGTLKLGWCEICTTKETNPRRSIQVNEVNQSFNS